MYYGLIYVLRINHHLTSNATPAYPYRFEHRLQVSFTAPTSSGRFRSVYIRCTPGHKRLQRILVGRGLQPIPNHPLNETIANPVLPRPFGSHVSWIRGFDLYSEIRRLGELALS